MPKYQNEITKNGFKAGEFNKVTSEFKTNGFNQIGVKISKAISAIAKKVRNNGGQPPENMPRDWDDLDARYSELHDMFGKALKGVKGDKEAIEYCKDFMSVLQAYRNKISQWKQNGVLQPGGAAQDVQQQDNAGQKKPAKPMAFRQRDENKVGKDKNDPSNDAVVIGDDEINETPGSADDDQDLVNKELKQAQKIQDFCVDAPKRLSDATKQPLAGYRKVATKAEEDLKTYAAHYKNAAAKNDIETLKKVVAGLSGMADKYNLDVIRNTVGATIRTAAENLMTEARTMSAKYPYKTNKGAECRLSNADFKEIGADMTKKEQELKTKFDTRTHRVETGTRQVLEAAQAKLNTLWAAV